MDIKKASYSMWDLFNIKKEIQEAWEQIKETRGIK